jgi:hypothetical protein
VHAEDVPRELIAEPVGDHRADVAALRAEPLVTQNLAHQPRPELGDVP